MSVSIPRKRIRMKCDAAKRTSDYMKDVFTSATPELWRGVDCQIEIGLFLNDVLVDDLSNVSTITLEIKDAATRETLLLTKTVDEWDAGVDTAGWNDGSRQHAVFALSGAETNIDLADLLHRSCWLVVSMVTVGGYAVTIQGTQLLIVEDGTGTTADPPDLRDNYYTKAICDARYVPIAGDGANCRFDGGILCIYNPDSTKWVPLTCRTVDGVDVLAPGAGVTL